MNTLPPLSLLEQWRNQGLTPKEVYQRCEDFMQVIESYQLKPLCKKAEPKPVILHPTNGRGRRKHNPEELYGLYQTMTLREIGRMKGISTERVRQILTRAGYTTRLHIGKSTKGKPVPLDKMITLRQAGLTYQAIGREVNLTDSTVNKHLKKAGADFKRTIPLTPIGCPRCVTNPKARGLCGACYIKWFKRGKPEDEAVRPKVLKPIGCEDCITKPFCKGFCKLCYGRKRDRELRGIL